MTLDRSKLAKILARLSPGTPDTEMIQAARTACKLVHDAGLTWQQVLAVEPIIQRDRPMPPKPPTRAQQEQFTRSMQRQQPDLFGGKPPAEFLSDALQDTMRSFGEGLAKGLRPRRGR